MALAEHIDKRGVGAINDLVVAKNRRRSKVTRTAVSGTTAGPRPGRFSRGRDAGGGVRTSAASTGWEVRVGTRMSGDGVDRRAPMGDRLDGLDQLPAPPSPPGGGKERSTAGTAPAPTAVDVASAGGVNDADESTSGVRRSSTMARVAKTLAVAMSPAVASTAAGARSGKRRCKLWFPTAMNGKQLQDQQMIVSSVKEGEETEPREGNVAATSAEENSTQCPETESGDDDKLVVGAGASVTPGETVINPRVQEMALSPLKTPTAATGGVVGGGNGGEEDELIDDVSTASDTGGAVDGDIPLLEGTAVNDKCSRVEGVEEPNEYDALDPYEEMMQGHRQVMAILEELAESMESPVSCVKVLEGTGSRAATKDRFGGGIEDCASGNVVPVATGAAMNKSRKVWNSAYNCRTHPGNNVYAPSYRYYSDAINWMERQALVEIY